MRLHRNFSSDIIGLIKKNIGHLLVVVGLVLTIFSILQTSRQIEKTTHWNRLNATYEVLDELTLLLNKNKILKLDSLSVENINKTTFCYKYEPSTNDIELVSFLNHIIIGCNVGYYDENLVWKVKKRAIISAYNDMKMYFEYYDEKYNIEGKEIRICLQLRNMVLKWKLIEKDVIVDDKYNEWLKEESKVFDKWESIKNRYDQTQ